MTEKNIPPVLDTFSRMVAPLAADDPDLLKYLAPLTPADVAVDGDINTALLKALSNTMPPDEKLKLEILTLAQQCVRYERGEHPSSGDAARDRDDQQARGALLDRAKHDLDLLHRRETMSPLQRIISYIHS